PSRARSTITLLNYSNGNLVIHATGCCSTALGTRLRPAMLTIRPAATDIFAGVPTCCVARTCATSSYDRTDTVIPQLTGRAEDERELGRWSTHPGWLRAARPRCRGSAS